MPPLCGYPVSCDRGVMPQQAILPENRSAQMAHYLATQVWVLMSTRTVADPFRLETFNGSPDTLGPCRFAGMGVRVKAQTPSLPIDRFRTVREETPLPNRQSRSQSHPGP